MAGSILGKSSHSRKLAKGGTTSTRKHRFLSFNQKISQIDIDPVRKRQRNAPFDEDIQGSSSHFRSSLDRWKDLNLSENFTLFTREIVPLCSSLPQLLHYNERVFQILLRYIEKGDSYCLEPLLVLLSSFAHDLGSRFEDYFSRAVTLVASLAVKHGDVEVIEWCFTCLAWLFKYLSRLLVPNLRPVFDIMAPLLGREPQKLHTTRFAAEAMSFLVRKAATVFAKDPNPLNIIIGAIFEDIHRLSVERGENAKSGLYEHGLKTLIFDSIKGIDRKLFSRGPCIYSCMIDHPFTSNLPHCEEFDDILLGVNVAL